MAAGKSYDWRGGLGLIGLVLGAVVAHLTRPWSYSALPREDRGGEFFGSPQMKDLLFHFGLLVVAGVVLGVLLGHFINRAKKASDDGRTT